MTERPEPGVRGDRDAVVTGQEPEAKDAGAPEAPADRLLDTPDASTPEGAEHPFQPSVTEDSTRADA